MIPPLELNRAHEQLSEQVLTFGLGKLASDYFLGTTLSSLRFFLLHLLVVARLFLFWKGERRCV